MSENTTPLYSSLGMVFLENLCLHLQEHLPARMYTQRLAISSPGKGYFLVGVRVTDGVFLGASNIVFEWIPQSSQIRAHAVGNTLKTFDVADPEIFSQVTETAKEFLTWGTIDGNRNPTRST